MLWAVRILAIVLIASFVIIFFHFQAHGAEEKQIALTFDDGPNPPVLEKLIPLLKEYKIPATFFVIGSVAADNPAWIKRETETGFEIENHSWGHENMKKLLLKKGPDVVSRNLQKTSEIIKILAHSPPHFFRPPYWEINPEIEKIAREEHLTPAKLGHPDINSLDYEDISMHRTAETLILRVEKLIADRERRGVSRHVLVFHELPLTVEALQTLIPYFMDKGYQFKRLDAMNLGLK